MPVRGIACTHVQYGSSNDGEELSGMSVDRIDLEVNRPLNEKFGARKECVRHSGRSWLKALASLFGFHENVIPSSAVAASISKWLI